jgi:CHAD domain-containing protein
MATMTEVERKYDVPVDFTVPDLSRLAAVAAVDRPTEHRLDATYYDTPDLRLAANHVTLRRRSGGNDAGWHIKRPTADGERTETHAPLTGPAKDVPPDVAAQVREVTGREPLAPVAHVRTRRVERPLRGADGTVLALVADDTVSTEALGDPAILQRWRELEVELVDGPQELLSDVDAALRAAGARPAGHASKLARALAGRHPDTAEAGPRKQDAVTDYLRAQRDTIRENEAGVREGDADAVHDMRVAIRRMRSTLRTFRRLLDADRTEPVRRELHWLAGLLGAVRDGDVLAERLTHEVAAVPSDLVLGPVAERVRERLAARTDRAREQLIAALDGPRYRTLLEAVDRLTGPSKRPTRADLFRRVRKTLRRADLRLADARRAARPDRDVPLHEARKAYKRARYAAETVAPLAGKPARRLARTLTRLQDVLGSHQDAIVTGQLVRELGTEADRAGENAFTYGVLEERQHEAGERSLRKLPKARRKATRRNVRHWLKA